MKIDTPLTSIYEPNKEVKNIRKNSSKINVKMKNIDAGTDIEI